MKKIYLILLVLIGMSISCTKNFEDFNTDKKRPVEVPGGFLFANAQKALGDHTATPNVNLNILKLIAQYWTETTYTDEANYDLANRSIMANQFLIYYRNHFTGTTLFLFHFVSGNNYFVQLFYIGTVLCM